MRVKNGGNDWEGPLELEPLVVIAADPERGRELADRLRARGFTVSRTVGPDEAAAFLAIGVAGVAEDPPRVLTEREREVLGGMARGLPDKAIADELGIGVRTVRFHIDHILRKLDAQNRTEAVAKSLLPGKFL